LADGKIEVTGQNGVNSEIAGMISGEQVERLVALGHALSDPIRVRMLGMMAEGRSCCDLPDLGVPAQDADNGICICEFEEYFDMGQSKVSYHMRKLKEAGLVREERRGKWSFYSLDRETAGGLIGEAADHLLSGPEKRGVGGGCC
jgi:ArsR family transcriptional regulator